MRIARFSHDGQVCYGLVLPADPAAAAEAANGASGLGPADVSTGHEDDGLIIAQLAGHPFGGVADVIFGSTAIRSR